MIESLLTLMSYGYRGYFGEVMDSWESLGVFHYLLPFLIIFSLIFAILNSVEIFKNNKAVNTIIALAIGLMAVRFDMVPSFFAEIFPRVGIALSVILAALIIIGVFMDKENTVVNWALVILSVIAVIIVFYNSFVAFDLGFASGTGFREFLPQTLLALVILGVIIAVVSSGGDNKKSLPKLDLKNIFGN